VCGARTALGPLPGYGDNQVGLKRPRRLALRPKPTSLQSRATFSQGRKLVQALLKWYRRHKRDLPWRRTKDPYRVWISEVMLQQTRVATVIPYYERFLKRFPTVDSLARAPEKGLLKAWSGLGYYRRALHLKAAAQVVVSEYGSEFPSDFAALKKLPGIGDYTAAAIASITRGEKRAVLDGNVVRVLTRLLDDDRDTVLASVKSNLQTHAQALIETVGARSAGTFNQAIMELGATVCTPRNPQCLLCPLGEFCIARKRGTQSERPVKRRKAASEKLQLAVAVVTKGTRLLLRRRGADVPVMPGFWELPETLGSKLGDHNLGPAGIRVGEQLGRFRHAITFRDYKVVVYQAKLSGRLRKGYRWVSLGEVQSLPLTTISRKALAVAQKGPGSAKAVSQCETLLNRLSSS